MLSTAVGLSHTYQVAGNSVDFLLAWSHGTEGARLYRAYDLVFGYLLVSAVFFAMGAYLQLADRDRGGLRRLAGRDGGDRAESTSL